MWTREKREADEVKLSGLPRGSAEVKPWLNALSDAVMACSSVPDLAFAWILDVESDDATFDTLGICEPRFTSLDSKIRTAITKYTVGETTNKHRDLSMQLYKAADDARTRKVPIRGRQL